MTARGLSPGGPERSATLHFIRHGESVANVERVFSNTGFKHPLTARGVAQARGLARRLAGLTVSVVYTSPLMRAVQSAQIFATRLQAPVVLVDALREADVGAWEDRSDQVGWDAHASVQRDWLELGLTDSRMPGGESLEDVCARFVPYVGRVARQWRGSGKRVLLVGHGSVLRSMLPLVCTNLSALGARLPPIPYCGEIEVVAARAGLTCTRWCGIDPREPFQSPRRGEASRMAVGSGGSVTLDHRG
ncbi:MAG: histidine phosphatase family protein [Chloroflexota bacterium]